jgi:hypothetical protein
MSKSWLLYLLSGATGLALILSAAAQNPDAPHHEATPGEGSGLHKELIAGITEADFLKLGDQPKTARVTLIAAYTFDNGGMNFNGYTHGGATYTIPTGWTVEVTFINPSPVPHSVVVVDRDMVRKLQVGEPAFAGASVPNPLMGLSAARAVFKFVASEPGEYAFACGFPSHALAGQWVALDISKDATIPTLKVGDAPAREAK